MARQVVEVCLLPFTRWFDAKGPVAVEHDGRERHQRTGQVHLIDAGTPYFFTQSVAVPLEDQSANGAVRKAYLLGRAHAFAVIPRRGARMTAHQGSARLRPLCGFDQPSHRVRFQPFLSGPVPELRVWPCTTLAAGRLHGQDHQDLRSMLREELPPSCDAMAVERLNRGLAGLSRKRPT